VKDETKSGYNLRCFEYTKGCKGRIMRCRYEGKHGDDVPYDAKMAYWYFNGANNTQPDANLSFIQ